MLTFLEIMSKILDAVAHLFLERSDLVKCAVQFALQRLGAPRLKTLVAGEPHFDEAPKPAEVGIDLEEIEHSAMIDRGLNGKRQAQRAQVPGAAHGMRSGLLGDR